MSKPCRPGLLTRATTRTPRTCTAAFSSQHDDQWLPLTISLLRETPGLNRTPIDAFVNGCINAHAVSNVYSYPSHRGCRMIVVAPARPPPLPHMHRWLPADAAASSWCCYACCWYCLRFCGFLNEGKILSTPGAPQTHDFRTVYNPYGTPMRTRTANTHF